MAVVRYYGAKPDSYDHRDYKVVYRQAEIPSRQYHYEPNVDLRKFVVKVYNQGSLRSCTANALCSAYWLDLKKQSKTLKGGYSYFNPSRLFLYYNTRRSSGGAGKDTGASIRDTVKALNRQGVCRAELWPYDVSEVYAKPPPECYQAAQGNNLCKYERLQQDIDQFRACLSDNCPFVFGFNIYRSFNQAQDGEVPMPTREERRCEPEGLHAVVAVGYNDKTESIIALNSWGPKWGDEGYFYMPYDFITDPNLCLDFWKISFACERGKPRPKDAKTWASEDGSSSGACGYGGVPTKGRGRQ